MKLTQYIPAVITLNIILGIIFGYTFEPNITISFFTITILISSLFISYIISNKAFIQSCHFNIISFILFFNIGIVSISIQDQSSNKNHYSNYIKQNNKIVLVIDKQLKSNNYYHKYFVNISQLNDNSVKGRVLLNISRDSLTNKTYNTGDKIYTESNFKLINKPLNPYQFNYRSYLTRQQIHYQISVKNKEIYFLNSEISIYSFLDKFRKKINTSLKNNNFKNDELAIINALLLGQRKDISKDLLQNYAEAGAMHLLAVSGLHIGVMLYLLNFLFKPIEYLKNGKNIKVIILIISLWLYAFLAGLSPSIIRAVTMFTAITIGQFSKKNTSTLHNLFISMFLLLLINPLYLFKVGFQLSYLAVFSIIYFYPLFIRFYNPKFWLIKKTWQLFTVSLSAQLGILPLSLYYFHQFPSLFFISSMVIIPFLGLILGLGILVIILSLLNTLPLFLAQLFSWIISKMNAFIEFIANQEAFLFKNISFSILLLITSYFIIISLYRLWNKSSASKLVIVLISIVLFQAVMIYEKNKKFNSNQFVIFNQSRNSLILNKVKNNVTIYHNLDSAKIKNNYAVRNYIIKKGKLNIDYKSIKNIYKVNNKTILIVDSLSVYNIPKLKTDLIILRQSPKININRLIAINNPKLIIADASNYKSYKKHWKNTCDSLDVEFYDTSVNGAFIIEY